MKAAGSGSAPLGQEQGGEERRGEERRGLPRLLPRQGWQRRPQTVPLPQRAPSHNDFSVVIPPFSSPA